MNKQVGNVQLMQRINRLKVLNLIRCTPDISRPVISEKTGLSLASVTNVTSFLIKAGLIYEAGLEDVDRVGRKSTLLRFNSTHYNLICIYVTPGEINSYLTDLDGKEKSFEKTPIKGLDQSEAESILLSHIRMLTESHGNKILGIGVAMPGLILDQSRFIFSSQMKWGCFDIKSLIESIPDIPVIAVNSTQLKTAHYFGKKNINEDRNNIFLDLEGGIGAALYSQGALSREILGEIGHTSVVKDGERCFCGNRGCLEAMCNSPRLIRLYETASGKTASSLAEIEELFKKGDVSAVSAVRDCGEYLGLGLANLVNLFNPSTIVISMGDFEACPSIFSVAEEEMKKRAFSYLTENVSIVKTGESKESKISGIAFNVCDHLFDIASPTYIVE